MKICLIGHACSPVRGSDPGVTWNWARHLSQFHRVWVLTHPAERPEVERFLAEHPNPNLQFVWVTIPRWLDSWDPADPNSRVGFRHYVLWQREALKEARRLNFEVGFDIAHHVSWGTVNIPPPLWRLGVPFVWGPVGGAQTAPRAFRDYFGKSWRGEAIRRFRLELARHLPALRNAARHSALVLAGNRETIAYLKRSGAARVVHFLDSGVREDFLVPGVPQPKSGGEFKVLWAGQLIRRKCFSLAAEAVAKVKEVPCQLLVAGRGPLQEEMQALVTRLGIASRVRFLGHVQYKDMPWLYRSVDAFLFTSLRDSFGSQVLEAMASALPIITLDHQGAGTFVPPEAGIKVPAIDPRQTVADLAAGIERLARREGERRAMSEAAWRCAQTETWPRRAQRLGELYEEVLRLPRDRAPLRTFSKRMAATPLPNRLRRDPKSMDGGPTPGYQTHE